MCILCPVCVAQWRREQDFDLQLLERAVQGEEAQVHRSVQGEERPPEHHERPRPHSDEWLTFCSTAMTRPANELDPDPLDYGLDLKKEVNLHLLSQKTHTRTHTVGLLLESVDPIGAKVGTAAAAAMQTTRPRAKQRDQQTLCVKVNLPLHNLTFYSTSALVVCCT